jgi:outer membrane protein
VIVERFKFRRYLVAGSTLYSTGQARLAATFLFFSLLAALPAAAQQPEHVAGELSLEEAISLARQYNPSLRSQQNDVHVAQWQSRQARADFIPSANASTSLGYTAPGEQRFGAVGFGDRPAYYSSSYTLGLQLDVTGSKLLQPGVARTQLRAVEQRVNNADAELRSRVAHQYLAILQAQENVAQAAREVTRTGEHVRLAEVRLEVGAGTQLDVRRAEVQQGQAEIRAVQAENSYATSILALAQLLGVSVSPDVRLTSAFSVFQPQWSSDELVDRALRNNPGLLAARASSEAARTGVRQAQSAYLPSLRLGMNLNGSVYSAADVDPLVNQQLNASTFQNCMRQNQLFASAGIPTQTCLDPANAADRALVRERIESDNPNWPFDFRRQPLSASLTLSLPIFNGMQREVQVAQAQASAANAAFAVRSQELQLQTDVATALRNLQTAQRTAQIQERVRATAAEELRLAQERFRFGAASSVEVTDAQTSLSEAERAQIDAVYAFHQSLAALEAFIGEALR